MIRKLKTSHRFFKKDVKDHIINFINTKIGLHTNESMS